MCAIDAPIHTNTPIQKHAPHSRGSHLERSAASTERSRDTSCFPRAAPPSRPSKVRKRESHVRPLAGCLRVSLVKRIPEPPSLLHSLQNHSLSLPSQLKSCQLLPPDPAHLARIIPSLQLPSHAPA